MQIVFQCPKCSSKLEIDASDAGSGIECPICGRPLVVPCKGAEPGTTIGGFKLVKLIGRGGMGEVYLARQMSLDRMVALKLMTRSDMDGGAAARFLDEIRLTARLDHPYLVPAYEAGEDGNVIYLAMAFIRGSSLHDHVRRNGPLTESEALILGRKIASALGYAWREIGLLHRDIKPANILMDSNGEPRLADLGLAKCAGRQDGRTISGALLGTPNYMSPEQAEGRNDLDVRSDIYGFGSTLYTAVTGRIPYEAPSVLETLRRQATEPLPDPRTYAPRLTEGFVDLAGAMLARDPHDRPSDWEEVIKRIDERLVTMPGSAALLPIVEASRRPARRRGRHKTWRSIAGLAAGVIVAASMGIIAGIVLFQPVRLVRAPPSEAPPPNAAAAAVAATEATPMTPDDPGGVPSDAGSTGGAGGPLPPELREGVPERHPLRRRIMDAIREAPEMRKRALDRAGERLTAMAARDIKAGRFVEGLAAVEAYRGPFGEELAELRAELAERLRQAQRDAAATAARDLVRAATETCAAALVNGDFLSAADAVRNLRIEPEADPEGAAVKLRDTVDELTSLPTAILKSFSAQIGRDVPVEFRSGQAETLRIAGVENDTIIGRRMLREGFIERPFKPADLSLKEKVSRIALPDPASARIALGLVHLEHGDKARALDLFAKAGTPLGTAMAAALTAK